MGSEFRIIIGPAQLLGNAVARSTQTFGGRQMFMREFPVKGLLPIRASLGGRAEDVSMRISLKPFELDGSIIETSLWLESFALPSLNWTDLAGKEFLFAANPAPGYIDGSIYIEHAHHPVDVNSLYFDATRSEPSVIVRGFLMLEFEGLDDYANAQIDLTAPLDFAEP